MATFNYHWNIPGDIQGYQKDQYDCSDQALKYAQAKDK
jgi:hypothetical protein